eukprot:TRINITY_DN10916_c0_g1_i1.p1 TRINITY_DN10916_c0_g1~~TRINITY_DN10916_c0_g1_i1.p1  ORF type:complete len:955 (-),score=244.59 TRINITY_DN10916_c0_g1_i1:150-3014(-)
MHDFASAAAAADLTEVDQGQLWTASSDVTNSAMWNGVDGTDASAAMVGGCWGGGWEDGCGGASHGAAAATGAGVGEGGGYEETGEHLAEVAGGFDAASYGAGDAYGGEHYAGEQYSHELEMRQYADAPIFVPQGMQYGTADAYYGGYDAGGEGYSNWYEQRNRGARRQANVPATGQGPTTLATQVVGMIQEFLTQAGKPSGLIPQWVKNTQLEVDKDGYVQLSQLVAQHMALNRKAFGSVQAVLRAIKAQGQKTLILDKSGRKVRLLRWDEIVRMEAMQEVLQHSRDARVPVADLMQKPSLGAAFLQSFASEEDARTYIKKALEHEESTVQVVGQGQYFMRRPYGPQLRKAAEKLLSDNSLMDDPRLRARVQQSSTGDIPLTWLCARYADQLNISDVVGHAETMEVAAMELCKALAGSDLVIVDASRLTVRRKKIPARILEMPPGVSVSQVAKNNSMNASINNIERAASASSYAASAHAASSGGANGGGTNNAQAAGTVDEGGESTRKRSLRNAGIRLQQLLDFYFEPFNLQHNRLILDLVAQRAANPIVAGPWPVEALRDFEFSLEDLTGLGRIASELARLRIPAGSAQAMEKIVGPLKHLRCAPDGQLSVKAPPEVRCFTAVPSAPAEVSCAAMRYLAVSCEQRGQAPPGFVSVLSLNVEACLQDKSGSGEQRRARLKRQLLLHHTDLICLQGCDAESNDAASVSTSLAGEGYGYAVGRDDAKDGGACSIFWDRSRWQLRSQQKSGASISVVVSSFEHEEMRLRVACLRPAVPTMEQPDLGGLLGGEEDSYPLIACCDLAHIGGAEVASVYEELAPLSSVMLEAVGKELSTPMVLSWTSICQPGPDAAASPSSGDADASAEAAPENERSGEGSTTVSPVPVPMRDDASGLIEMHHPDTILYRGMAATTALSCHTLGYMANMAPEELLHQFPALRLPIVAAFDWTKMEAASCQ